MGQFDALIPALQGDQFSELTQIIAELPNAQPDRAVRLRQRFQAEFAKLPDLDRIKFAASLDPLFAKTILTFDARVIGVTP